MFALELSSELLLSYPTGRQAEKPDETVCKRRTTHHRYLRRQIWLLTRLKPLER